MTTLTFVDALPESVTTGKKGRPSLFTPETQAALAARPGQYALIQENVNGRSRVSTLRAEFPDFEFEGRTIETKPHTKADGTETTTQVVNIYARAKVAAPEVADSVAEVTTDAAPATPKTRKAPAKPKA